jgi:hypothetical protein
MTTPSNRDTMSDTVAATDPAQEIAGEATAVSIPTDLRRRDSAEQKTPPPNISLPDPAYEIVAPDGDPSAEPAPQPSAPDKNARR